MKIVETDNLGGDYPDESFLNLPTMQKEDAERIADVINSIHCRSDHSRRYWKVVENDYKLQPGFEP